MASDGRVICIGGVLWETSFLVDEIPGRGVKLLPRGMQQIASGMAVSAARGVALVAAAEKTDNLYEYTPMQIKQAVVGYGKAEMQQVQQMVKMLLSMKEIAKPDDAADALAVAITHAHTGNARAQFKIM